MVITLRNHPDTLRTHAEPAYPPRRRHRRRRLAVGVLSAIALLAPVACSAHQTAAPPGSAPSEPSRHAGPTALKLSGEGTLAAPAPGATAVTYDPALAPVGAKISASMVPSGSSTTVQLAVSGLLPSHGYAIHAHTKSCGSTGKDAGPHFQHHIDPAATPDKPSSDPAYANPKNEIWLDLTTDASGAARKTTTVPFTFTDRAPGSIVLHKDPVTMTEPGKAGTAGDRIACMTLPKGTPANP